MNYQGEEIRRRLPRKFNLDIYGVLSEDDKDLIDQVISEAYWPCEDHELNQPFFDVKAPDTSNDEKDYRIMVVYPVRIQMLDMNSMSRVVMTNEMRVYDPVFGTAKEICRAQRFQYEQRYDGRTALSVTVRSHKFKRRQITKELMIVVRNVKTPKKILYTQEAEETKANNNQQLHRSSHLIPPPPPPPPSREKRGILRSFLGSLGGRTPAIKEEIEDIDEDSDDDANRQHKRRRLSKNH